MVLGAVLFVLGFTAVFMVMNILFAELAFRILRDLSWVTRLLGVLVIVMGVVFMGGLDRLQQDRAALSYTLDGDGTRGQCRLRGHNVAAGIVQLAARPTAVGRAPVAGWCRSSR